MTPMCSIVKICCILWCVCGCVGEGVLVRVGVGVLVRVGVCEGG